MTKGDDTRQRILQRALELASTVGFEGLSIGQLAVETSMSKSGLFAHFDSKEDLQLQLLETARESFVDTVFRPAVRAPRGEPRLRALFDHWLEWEKGSVTPGGCPLIVAAAEYDDRPGAVRETIRAVQRELHEAVVTATEMGVEAGHFRADLDPGQFAYELHGIVLAFHLYHRLLGDEAAETQARAAFESLLDRSRLAV